MLAMNWGQMTDAKLLQYLSPCVLWLIISSFVQPAHVTSS